MRETAVAKRARARKILTLLQRAYPDAKIALDFSTPLELLVATILSAQCTDERVNMVTPALFRKYPTAHALATATIAEPAAGDFGRDGRADLVFRNAATGDLAIWLMAGADRVSVAVPQPAGVADLNWRPVGAHDLDGNGSADILWRQLVSGRNVAWLMNGTQRLSGVFLTPDTLADTNWQIAGTGHFDAGASPDIVWRHPQTGDIAVSLMNGTRVLSSAVVVPGVPLAWEIQ